MAFVEDAASQRANSAFVRSSMREPMLNRDYEQSLARRWRDAEDISALHTLVRSHTRLVISAAGKFRRYGLPYGDLVQEGNLGLMQAAFRFDPDREVRFSTYAAWWIRSCMQDYVLRNWSVVRVATTAAQKTLFFNLRRLQARIEEASGRPLDDTGRRRIAGELNVPVSELVEMERRLGQNDISIDGPLSGSDDRGLDDFLPDEGPSPEETVIATRDGKVCWQWLHEALDELKPRERHIIWQRRMTEPGATLEELGRGFGISKERVRQIEVRALGKLRSSLAQHITETADIL